MLNKPFANKKHDAHAHVMLCPDNRPKPDMYVPEAIFKEHHRKRRQYIINEKMRNLPVRTRGLLSKIIKKELGDLGIRLV